MRQGPLVKDDNGDESACDHQGDPFPAPFLVPFPGAGGWSGLPLRASASAARFLICSSTERHSARTWARPNASAPGRAITTRSIPSGKRSGHSLKHSRQSRLTLLRETAPPTFRPTTTPSRGTPEGSGRSGDGRFAIPVRGRSCAATKSVKCGVPTRRPPRCAFANSECLRSRWARPKPKRTTSYKWSAPGACGPCAADFAAPCGHRVSTCGRENRACARGECCAAGRCAS